MALNAILILNSLDSFYLQRDPRKIYFILKCILLQKKMNEKKLPQRENFSILFHDDSKVFNLYMKLKTYRQWTQHQAQF